MPRRKQGAVLPLELQLLETLAEAREASHGFALASALSAENDRALTAHGTLYKALARLQERGLVTSTWEDKAEANAQGRPPRRLYEVTGEGIAIAHAERSRIAAASTGLAALLAGGPQ